MPFSRFAFREVHAHRERRDGRLGRAILRACPQVHFVLLAAFVLRRHLIAADQEPQRVRRVANLDAEVRSLRPIHVHRQLRFARVQRRVHVDDAGQGLRAVDGLFAERLTFTLGYFDITLDNVPTTINDPATGRTVMPCC